MSVGVGGSNVSRWVVVAVALVGLAATGAGGPTEAHLTLHPDREFTGAPFEAQARGFLPFEELTWRWDGEPIAPVDSESEQAGPEGSARAVFFVPDGQERGAHEVSVVGESGASASAPFFVEDPTGGGVYRLPTSTTTSTAATEDVGSDAAAPVEPVVEARTEPSGAAEAPTTTTRAEEDVPDRFGVHFEDAGTGGDGPPSWLPALGPAAIVALFGGRIFVRHLTREVDVTVPSAPDAER